MRIVALDLIRFFAALSVVFYHYLSRNESNTFPIIGEVTKYGYLGVPLFFIISGYVIALSANNRTALQFGVSRFTRLYPALWAGVLFTTFILTTFTDKQYSLSQILANFTLINEYLGYDDIDGVYWTLKAELKFYACVFILLSLGIFQKHKIWLSLWMGITVLYALFQQPFFMGWFITPAYSSFFIAGVTLSLIQNNGSNRFNHFILVSSLLVSTSNAYRQADGFLDNPSAEEKLISIAIVWLFYLLMYYLSIGKIKFKRREFFVTLGALTYPLYLIHNMAGKAIIDKYSILVSENIVVPIVIMLMIFISWTINMAIEKPLATPMKNYLLSIFNRNF